MIPRIGLRSKAREIERACGGIVPEQIDPPVAIEIPRRRETRTRRAGQLRDAPEAGRVRPQAETASVSVRWIRNSSTPSRSRSAAPTPRSVVAPCRPLPGSAVRLAAVPEREFTGLRVVPYDRFGALIERGMAEHDPRRRQSVVAAATTDASPSRRTGSLGHDAQRSSNWPVGGAGVRAAP